MRCLKSVDIHFRDTFSTSLIQPSRTSLWAQFMYYIIFYSFKHDSSPCIILGEIEKVWFRGYESVPLGPFAWTQLMHATKWARDTSSTSGSWRRSCIQNVHPKIAFMLWVTVVQSFCHNPVLPLNTYLALIGQLHLLALTQMSLPMVWNFWPKATN